MTGRISELQRILDTSSGEGDLQRFLEANVDIVYHTLNTWSTGYVLKKFPLGAEYITDFVTLQPISGGWNICLLEIEPPEASLFTKTGTEHERLRAAAKQIEDWQMMLNDNQKRSYIVRRLAEAARSGQVLDTTKNQNVTTELRCSKDWPIDHPGSCLRFRYFIGIGRRANLTEDQIKRKAHKSFNRLDYEVFTCDRFLDTAKQLRRK